MECEMTLEWASIDTPVGPVSVACGAAGVAEVRFGTPPEGGISVTGSGGTGSGPDGGSPDRSSPDAGSPDAGSPDAGSPDRSSPGENRPDGSAPGHAVLAARRQLAEYFSGQRQEFDLPIDWSGFGPAQRQVLGRLHADVGYGETVTYGTLADRAGIPAGPDVIPARAVGQIMGSNPIPVIVPCHRVVASDGLGGYSGGAGPEVKRWLLILEGSLPPTLDWVPARPLAG
jgi:methylated-DNA-[protein]-cysteine S-methyltransferase